jgi:hypothetical protein
MDYGRTMEEGVVDYSFPGRRFVSQKGKVFCLSCDQRW